MIETLVAMTILSISTVGAVSMLSSRVEGNKSIRHNVEAQKSQADINAVISRQISYELENNCRSYHLKNLPGQISSSLWRISNYNSKAVQKKLGRTANHAVLSTCNKLAPRRGNRLRNSVCFTAENNNSENFYVFYINYKVIDISSGQAITSCARLENTDSRGPEVITKVIYYDKKGDKFVESNSHVILSSNE